MVDNSYGPAQPKLCWSYKQLDKGSDLFALCLYNRGIRRAQSVAVLLYNCAEWALTFWACEKLGATCVPLDPRSVSRKNKLAHYLRVIRPAALVVCDEDKVKTLQQNPADKLQIIELKLLAQSE